MAPKKKAGLQTVQKETDELERKVNALVQYFNTLGVSERAETSQRCSELQSTVTAILTTLQKLTKADEWAPVGDYDQRKRQEEERLRTLQTKLRALTVQPQDNSAEDEDDSEDEDSQEEHADFAQDDDDDDDDDEGDDRKSAQKSDVCYVVLSSFRGQEEGDLIVKKGAVVKILEKSDDGWWFAQDKEGNKGLVPKTYLKKMSPNERVAEIKNDDDEDEEDGDDDEDEVQEGESDPADRKPSTASNWDTVRQAVSEIDATDVLSAMGAIPPGFRPSTLSKLLEEGTSYRASHYIQPRLSQSELSFKDLQLDPDTGKVLARPARVCVNVILWSCRMIPPPGVGLRVLSRHVRLCAFNGTEVLSNVHTVRASYTPSSPKTWSFSPRVSSMLPSLLDGDCFFRCDSHSPDLGILFELGVTYIRNSTGERGDLSCGWAFLKLFDENGALIPLRTQELIVHGGTPYEGVVDTFHTSTKKGGSTGVLHQILMTRKLPKLIIRLRSPNTRTREQLSLLPDTLLGCMSTVPLLVLYRQLLADTLLLDRVTMQNADLICSSVLATFPKVLDQSDLMDAFRKSWVEQENNLKRSDKLRCPILSGPMRTQKHNVPVSFTAPPKRSPWKPCCPPITSIRPLALVRFPTTSSRLPGTDESPSSTQLHYTLSNYHAAPLHTDQSATSQHTAPLHTVQSAHSSTAHCPISTQLHYILSNQHTAPLHTVQSAHSSTTHCPISTQLHYTLSNQHTAP
ncbi:nephrocystin-1 isoform X1 [Clarias gariepinus]|uniref:nephrocystin-1 isoform X1 n=1 Tax=Clarias gariepinus TaxID=13013 RepID=UPI00234E19F0|nr:nephrocystin-1 isoform X1 [Clarias gariepinus]